MFSILLLIALSCIPSNIQAHDGIALYQPKDKEALTAIIQKNWDLLVNSADFSPEHMFTHRAAMPWFPDNSLQIVVYRHDNKPVGFTTYYDQDGGYRRLELLAVDQEYRGRGYGEELVRSLLDDARKRKGIFVIEVVVALDNPSAQKLYRKLGFHEGCPPYAYPYRYPGHVVLECRIPQ